MLITTPPPTLSKVKIHMSPHGLLLSPIRLSFNLKTLRSSSRALEQSLLSTISPMLSKLNIKTKPPQKSFSKPLLTCILLQALPRLLVLRTRSSEVAALRKLMPSSLSTCFRSPPKRRSLKSRRLILTSSEISMSHPESEIALPMAQNSAAAKLLTSSRPII